MTELSDLVEHTAAAIDDEYQLTLVRWLNGDTELIGRSGSLRTSEATASSRHWRSSTSADCFTNDDPAARR